jgi:hypothetical protein
MNEMTFTEKQAWRIIVGFRSFRCKRKPKTVAEVDSISAEYLAKHLNRAFEKGFKAGRASI